MNKFDIMAKDYDTDNRKIRAEAIAKELLTFIQADGTKSAVEYGCGTGIVGLQIANAFSSLVLVDSSAGMIGEVKKKIAE